MSETRILIVDDHEVVREGLRALLNRRESFRVVGEAGTVAQAIDGGRAHASRTSSSWTYGCPTAAASKRAARSAQSRPETKVIMLTSYADEDAVFASILAGAAGYLLKQTRGTRAGGGDRRPSRAASRCSTRR